MSVNASSTSIGPASPAPVTPGAQSPTKDQYFDASAAGSADAEKISIADSPPDPRLGGHTKESVELDDAIRYDLADDLADSASSTSSEDHVDAIRPAPSANASRVTVGGGPFQALSTKSSLRSLPPLRRPETKLAQKDAHPWQHLGITLGLPMVILFDLVLPIIVYYTWYNKKTAAWKSDCAAQFGDEPCPLEKPELDKHIMGAAVACFGFGEIWILGARVWRLYLHPEECAPLLSKSKWELDATCWVYLMSVLLALAPFVIGSELEIAKLYLYGPSFIMVFLGLLMVMSLIPFKLPFRINSQPKGTPMRPFIYYAAEDFIAVDGLQDREFRVRYNNRYEKNETFRRFFVWLTLWWIFGVMVYEGAVTAIIFTMPFHHAFGASLGVLFGWIAIWAACTHAIVEWEMNRENKLYETGVFDA